MCKTNFIDDRLSKINFRLIVVPRFGPLPRSSCISISNREFNILCYVSRPRIADALSISRNSDRETWEDLAFPYLPTCNWELVLGIRSLA